MAIYNLRLDNELMELVKSEAKKQERSINYIVANILKAHFNYSTAVPVPQISKNDAVTAAPIKVNNKASAPQKQNSLTKSAVNKETIAQQVKRIAEEKLAKKNAMPSQLAKPAQQDAPQIDTTELSAVNTPAEEDDFNSF